MNPTDRILDTVQREVELDGRSHADCVYLNDISFTIKRSEYQVPSTADTFSAAVDVAWFFSTAEKQENLPHPQPEYSFWLRVFGEDAYPYGYTWDIDTLLKNIYSSESWRRAILYNPPDQENPPCVLCYQFHPQLDFLDVSVTMRSSDVHKILPQDVAMTDIILCNIAERSGLKPGDMTFNIGNAHAFYEDMEYVEEFIVDWGD